MLRVLITGCSSGIGRALAVALTDGGYDVIATARSRSTLDDLDVHQRLQLDVTSAESVESAVSAAGDIDILINNAGVSVWGPIETTDFEHVQRIFDTNVFGVVRMTQAVVPSMRNAGGGTIVNISSIAALRPGSPMLGWYGATKHALEVLSESLQAEVRHQNIKVLLILPGPVVSDLPTNRVRVGLEEPPYAEVGAEFLAGIERRTDSAYPTEMVVDCVLAALRDPDPPLRWAATPDVQPLLDPRP
jgi:short-subunit dehydrogenase